jgi:hypothetical protein
MGIKQLMVWTATLGLLFLWGCKKTNPEVIDSPAQPSITITNPIKNSQMLEDSFLKIQVSHLDSAKKIKKLVFYFDQKYIGSDIYPPFEFVQSNISIAPGMHYVHVEALDENNAILCVDSTAFKSYEIRSKYFGNFNFKIHETSRGGVTPKIDTLYEYQGVIKEFEYTDYNYNYFWKKWTNTYHKRLLTIYFSKNTNIISEVKENGKIDENMPTHKYQIGQFSDENNLYFEIGSGGLGGGYDYEVIGTRL